MVSADSTEKKTVGSSPCSKDPQPPEAEENQRKRNRLVPLTEHLPHHEFGHGVKREITIYVKGFLSEGEQPADYKKWFTSHQTLISTHDWGDVAFGYCWNTGDYKTKYYATVGIGLLRLYRTISEGVALLSPATLAVAAAQDLAFNVGRLIYQYRLAESNAKEHASHLSEVIKRMRPICDKIRIVAHSLGCKKTIEAATMLDPSDRPDELHLCAPAVCEHEILDLLPKLARDHTYIYYNPGDMVLATSFRVMTRGYTAVGQSGLVSGVRSPKFTMVSTEGHFGFWIHQAYALPFSRFAMPQTPAQQERLNLTSVASDPISCRQDEVVAASKPFMGVISELFTLSPVSAHWLLQSMAVPGPWMRDDHKNPVVLEEEVKSVTLSLTVLDPTGYVMVTLTPIEAGETLVCDTMADISTAVEVDLPPSGPTPVTWWDMLTRLFNGGATSLPDKARPVQVALSVSPEGLVSVKCTAREEEGKLPSCAREAPKVVVNTSVQDSGYVSVKFSFRQVDAEESKTDAAVPELLDDRSSTQPGRSWLGWIRHKETSKELLEPGVVTNDPETASGFSQTLANEVQNPQSGSRFQRPDEGGPNPALTNEGGESWFRRLWRKECSQADSVPDNKPPKQHTQAVFNGHVAVQLTVTEHGFVKIGFEIQEQTSWWSLSWLSPRTAKPKGVQSENIPTLDLRQPSWPYVSVDLRVEVSGWVSLSLIVDGKPLTVRESGVWSLMSYLRRRRVSDANTPSLPTTGATQSDHRSESDLTWSAMSLLRSWFSWRSQKELFDSLPDHRNELTMADLEYVLVSNDYWAPEKLVRVVLTDDGHMFEEIDEEQASNNMNGLKGAESGEELMLGSHGQVLRAKRVRSCENLEKIHRTCERSVRYDTRVVATIAVDDKQVDPQHVRVCLRLDVLTVAVGGGSVGDRAGIIEHRWLLSKPFQ
eukprot:Rmarinus@m.9698